MLHRIVAIALVLFGVACSAGSTSAAWVTYDFTGVITKVTAAPTGPIPVAGTAASSIAIHQGTSTFSGSVSFEDNTPAEPPPVGMPYDFHSADTVLAEESQTLRRGLAYRRSDARISVVVDNAFSIEFLGDAGSAAILDRDLGDDATTPRYDGFSIVMSGVQAVHITDNPWPGFWVGPQYLQLDLGGDTSLFDNDPFDSLSDIEGFIPLLYSRTFTATSFYTTTDGDIYQLGLSGSITSFERAAVTTNLEAVPEPGSWTLLALGSVAIFSLARRKIA